MTTSLPYIGTQVRASTRDDGEWYVLADVCSVLGLDETAAVELLEPADVAVPFVSEAGALALTSLSARPAARDFQRRVVGES